MFNSAIYTDYVILTQVFELSSPMWCSTVFWSIFQWFGDKLKLRQSFLMIFLVIWISTGTKMTHKFNILELKCCFPQAIHNLLFKVKTTVHNISFTSTMNHIVPCKQLYYKYKDWNNWPKYIVQSMLSIVHTLFH